MGDDETPYPAIDNKCLFQYCDEISEDGTECMQCNKEINKKVNGASITVSTFKDPSTGQCVFECESPYWANEFDSNNDITYSEWDNSCRCPAFTTMLEDGECF